MTTEVPLIVGGERFWVHFLPNATLTRKSGLMGEFSTCDLHPRVSITSTGGGRGYVSSVLGSVQDTKGNVCMRLGTFTLAVLLGCTE
ncbi:hypothetical protein CDAR_466041 [Caerostris darwini]|uniref:Uncharacterized protein n=1 Tax=Caerostris darwini TaxID=1538125 RepID=A0AAV4WMM3_9ARAC|nr:hypothetical protein CDAR_466041 [Caerostris darwini]